MVRASSGGYQGPPRVLHALRIPAHECWLGSCHAASGSALEVGRDAHPSVDGFPCHGRVALRGSHENCSYTCGCSGHWGHLDKPTALS